MRVNCYVLIFFLMHLSQSVHANVGLRPINLNSINNPGARATGSSADLSATEAGYGCIDGDCRSGAKKSEQSSLMNFCENMKERAVWAREWTCSNAAHYDDGQSRDSLVDLRRKAMVNPNSLNDLEKAILTAANQTGMISFKKCGGVGNAFLVRIDGRDAVVSTPHLFFNNLKGEYKSKKCTRSEYMADAVYFPNASYVDSGKSKEEQRFVYEEVKLESRGAMGFPEQGTVINPEGDWMVMFLSKQISTEKAPDGRVRGFLKAEQGLMSNSTPRDFNMTIIGLDPEYAKTRSSETSSYQTCSSRTNQNGYYYQCDTSAGSSGSMIGSYDETSKEIKFVGVHSSSGAGGTTNRNYLVNNYGVRPTGRGHTPNFD